MLRLAIPALAFLLLVSGCSLMGDKTEPAPPPPVKAVEPPPPPPPPPPPLTHTLKKGETVAAVAKRYGVSAQSLISANNLANAKAVKAGMVLTIPGKTAPDVTKPTGKIEKEGPDSKAEKTPKGGSKKDPFGIEAAMAPDKKGKGKKGGKFVDDDATYERVKADFHEYARKWLEKSQNMAEYNKDKKDVKLEEGRYVATYTVILMDTMETEVKRVDYDGTPYVGHITYRLRVHRTFGPTAQAAQASKDEIVQEEFMREIFSYSSQKRAWR